jgi:hypothetical protein
MAEKGLSPDRQPLLQMSTLSKHPQMANFSLKQVGTKAIED